MATDPPASKPHVTPAAEAARLAREERQAQALRQNLRRRKAQDRGRAEAPPKTTERPDAGEA
ncbi:MULTISPECIES: hypothetical protein [unclassified Acidisoma]|jgi:hypothetical protein|uniref:hypothetical protein n=1 Tax=unclassified Acidisoma TaxID=2634065 RepID=UPI00131DE042|nr:MULTISPECIES: hypothetical protein [unclassified Acidisoma]